VAAGPVARAGRAPYTGLTGYEATDGPLFVGLYVCGLVEEARRDAGRRRLLVVVGPSAGEVVGVARRAAPSVSRKGAIPGSDG
jgi:hypothetical protein